jgi:hypothetical protein
MSYTIVFRTRNTQGDSAGEAMTALQAMAIGRRPPRRSEEIKYYITLPQEGEIGVENASAFGEKGRGRIASQRLKHSSHWSDCESRSVEQSTEVPDLDDSETLDLKARLLLT